METVRRGSPVPVGHAGVQGRDRRALPQGDRSITRVAQRFQSGGVGGATLGRGAGINTGQPGASQKPEQVT